MVKKIIDLIRGVLPLSSKTTKILEELENYLEEADILELKSLLKTRKAELLLKSFDVSANLCSDCEFPVIIKNTQEEDIVEYINKLNDQISEKANKKVFSEFSEKAKDLIPKLIGMNINGLDHIKKALCLQLFTLPTEPVHLLLLGDPGTGKTDLIRSAAVLSPISGFGLGSGTSGAGLTVTFKGDEAITGLLPSTDNGICAIDELNLMQEKDRAALYNAMEKGFITYDKGGKHIELDSRVKIVATANPKGDKFVGWTPSTIKQQLPFDSALLSRFHLVFVIKKPDIKEFIKISERIVSENATKPKIVSNKTPHDNDEDDDLMIKEIEDEDEFDDDKDQADKTTDDFDDETLETKNDNNTKNKSDNETIEGSDESFIQKFVTYSLKTDSKIPEKLKPQIIDFVASLKKNEIKYIIEISPRFVMGYSRMLKASARMNLRDRVNEQDLEYVKEIILKALTITKDK